MFIKTPPPVYPRPKIIIFPFFQKNEMEASFVELQLAHEKQQKMLQMAQVGAPLTQLLGDILHCTYPAGIYLYKLNNGDTKAMCEIYSKLTIKTPERRH